MKKEKKIIAISLILFFCGLKIFAQGVLPESVVAVSSKSSVKESEYGKEITLNIILNIKDTWHINANKPADESLTPTVIKIEKSEHFAVQRIKYPPSEMIKLQFSNEELALYESQATIKVTIIVNKNFVGKSLTINGAVQYQPCNNQTCLFPVNKPFSLKVDLKE